MDEDAFFQDLLAAVEQQLVSPQTRYVAKAFERLTAKGMSGSDAKERIAACLAEETDAMYRRKTGFDEKSYREKLAAIDPAERFEEDSGPDVEATGTEAAPPAVVEDRTAPEPPSQERPGEDKDGCLKD